MSWHHIFLALAAVALLFPTSRRIVIETAQNIMTPIVAVLVLIAMRVR